jgi:hypothetical protein
MSYYWVRARCREMALLDRTAKPFFLQRSVARIPPFAASFCGVRFLALFPY